MRLKLRTDLPSSRRRDLISALNGVARLGGRRLVDIQASPRAIRDLLSEVSPASARVTASTLTNSRSLAGVALREAGVQIHPGRSSSSLSPSWCALAAQLPGRRLSIGLSRFLRFCSERGVEPDQVDDGTFVLFRVALEEDSLVQRPGESFRSTSRLWTEAVSAVPGWPRAVAPAPSVDRCYALPCEAFPLSFQEDLQAFLSSSENRDVLSDHYAPSVRPSTCKARRKQILQLASALVLSGQESDKVISLGTLVEPTMAKAALRYLLGRHEGAKSTYLGQQAQLLCTIARHWVRADAKTIDELRKIGRNLAVRQRGMTPRNTERLRQFDLSANVRTLINLPPRIFDALGRRPKGREDDGRTAMLALAVELLIVAPMRVDNLVGLEVGRHLMPARTREPKAMHLLIPGPEIKNGVPLEMELPAETVRLLKLYLSRYHGRVAPTGSRFLFPNEAGGRRCTVAFSRAICDFVFRQTGLRMNVHLFRHLASKLHLQAHPDDLETTRRVLGHKSLETTLRNYTEMSNKAAYRRFDDVINEWRKPPGKAAARGSASSKRRQNS